MTNINRPKINPIQLPSHHPFVGIDLPWLLKQRAESCGDQRFLTWEPVEGEARHWTYRESYAETRRLASGLIARGVGEGETVLVHLDNSPESIFAWFACGLIGAIAVTTNPRCAGEEIAYFAEKSRAVGIITQPEFEPLAEKYLPSIAWSVITRPGESGDVMGCDSPLPTREPDPAAPFCIQFTSGTTSRPKAVVWTHANALWGAMVNARHICNRSEDVALVHAPMCHTLAQAWQVLASIWVGGRVVLQPKFSASRFWDVVVRNQCSWTTAGPFVHQALGDTPIPDDHKLRFVLGGMQCKPGDDPWGLRNFSAHGMTETVSHTFFGSISGPLEVGAVGRPAAEYELAIVDAEGNTVAPGRAGELLVKGVRGLSIFAEYMDAPEAMASAFTAEGFFRTGDIVLMREDGTMVFLDRLKDMLKVGGENVAASEIEKVALAVPGVSEVAVVAQPHPMLDEVPFAFVIPEPNAPADLADKLIAACKTSLADFKVPRGVRIVSDFPRSTGGIKVVKVELRQILLDEAAE